jgi:predicted secreted protein
VEPEINKTQMNYVTKNNNIVFYLPFEPSTKYSVSLKLENDIL